MEPFKIYENLFKHHAMFLCPTPLYQEAVAKANKPDCWQGKATQCDPKPDIFTTSTLRHPFAPSGPSKGDFLRHVLAPFHHLQVKSKQPTKARWRANGEATRLQRLSNRYVNNLGVGSMLPLCKPPHCSHSLVRLGISPKVS